MKRKYETSSSEYVPHMWCKEVEANRLVWFENLKNCAHCGMSFEYFSDEESAINERFMLGEISIEEQKRCLAKLEKCLTRNEVMVKDILT